MSRKRKNAGEGYGMMFSGAFKKKSDAAKKEKTRKGSFVKFAMTPQGGRYVVMTPRTNPRRKKAPKTTNPTELLVMGANPNPNEIVVPPGTTITIRTNPENPDRYTAAHARAAGITRHAPGLIQTGRQRRVASFFRSARERSSPSSLMRAYGRHRGRAHSGGPANKVFHEIFGENPQICGRMIGGLVCTRQPGHKGPHLPQGATLRPRSRHGWNPSAVALHESFTGKETKWVKVFDEPHMRAGDYAQLGQLLALYVKPISGGQVQQISFPKAARPFLVSDETARQIYFVDGDQDITAALSVFGARDRGQGLFELGEARRIDYKQRKEHVPDPEVDEWRHEFGEENGVRPIVLFDARQRRLLLEGGDYQIRTEGIVN